MKNPDVNKLICKFKEFILERDLTLQQVAIFLKISHSAVADILNGKTEKPHGRTLYKIKKFIGEK
jgi:transcriptional regulator with XRE-family HTH domain